MAKMRIAPEEREQVLLECLKMLFALRLDPARQRLISGFIGTYLRLSAEEVKVKVNTLSDAGEREGIMKLMPIWKEEGIKEGIKEGKREVALSLATRLLNRRLGKMQSSLLQRVHKLSLRQLETLSEALLDLKSPDELKEWLSARKC